MASALRSSAAPAPVSSSAPDGADPAVRMQLRECCEAGLAGDRATFSRPVATTQHRGRRRGRRHCVRARLARPSRAVPDPGVEDAAGCDHGDRNGCGEPGRRRCRGSWRAGERQMEAAVENPVTTAALAACWSTAGTAAAGTAPPDHLAREMTVPIDGRGGVGDPQRCRVGQADVLAARRR